jgi:geranylgeranyl diphosphate synthase type II
MAAAIELLHCASLVHDDMPCFDDAELRRGQPTIHRAFGESTALLVGDALIVAAFETVAAVDGADAGRVVSLVRLLARAAGSPHGLVAGQAWEAEPSLFVAASVGAAIAAGADGAAWAAVGERVGAAYQVADDLLDAFGDDASVGKPLGRDEALGRPNVALRLGCDGAVRRLRALADEACAAVPECPGAGTLRTILVQVSERLVPANLRQSAA